MRKRIPGTRIPVEFLENTPITKFLKCYPWLKGRKEELTFIKSLLQEARQEERERIMDKVEEYIVEKHDCIKGGCKELDDVLSIIRNK